jgi:hypothetical protein
LTFPCRPPFDLNRARKVYKALFDSAENLIIGKKLLVVAPRDLTRSPFNALVTTVLKVSFPTNYEDYRDVNWMAREHAITVVPVAFTLSLRRHLSQSHGAESYAQAFFLLAHARNQ